MTCQYRREALPRNTTMPSISIVEIPDLLFSLVIYVLRENVPQCDETWLVSRIFSSDVPGEYAPAASQQPGYWFGPRSWAFWILTSYLQNYGELMD